MHILSKTINGLKITCAAQIHDYIQLSFGNQVGLSIYSNIIIIPITKQLLDFVGETVLSVDYANHRIGINCTHDLILEIENFRRSGSESAEVMQLNRIGQPPVIFN
jgi:hypothetical protein